MLEHSKVNKHIQNMEKKTYTKVKTGRLNSRNNRQGGVNEIVRKLIVSQTFITDIRDEDAKV